MSVASTSPIPLSAFAGAKINLALHVVGRRADGYHLLDSLVAFADVGDTLELADDGARPLTIVGPFGADLRPDRDNLVSRAAAAHAAASGSTRPASLRLIKRLPVASGLGGGSADAAATLRLLNAIGPMLPQQALHDIATRLGADVPMCLASKPARTRGIGEIVTPLARMPALSLVLANPGVAMSTPHVFSKLARRDNPSMPSVTAAFADAAALAAWLGQTRNDLQAPAVALAPVIQTCLNAMAALPACMLARMSGSGATVFGIFTDQLAASGAAKRLQAEQPSWWVVSTATASS